MKLLAFFLFALCCGIRAQAQTAAQTTDSIATEQTLMPAQAAPEMLPSLHSMNRIGIGIGYNGATSGGSYPGSMLSGLYARRINSWLELEATLGYFIGASEYNDQFYDNANVLPGTGSVSTFQRPILDAFIVGDIAANFRPFASGFLSLLSIGAGVSLRGINGIQLSNYYVQPPLVPGGQTTLVIQPRVYRALDAGIVLRVEYCAPLSESIAVSIRGNGYLLGRISPMWGLHALVNVMF